MNLWLRLLTYFLTARWRPALTLPAGVSVLRFRAWPGDIDTSLHVNNGGFNPCLTVMALASRVACQLIEKLS